MGGLLSNILQWLLGTSIEKTGDLQHHRVARRVAVVLLVILSAGIAVASAFFWTSQRYPGVVGLWQWVQRGGPAWVLAAPAFALVTLLLVLLPLPGKFTPAAIAAIGTIGFTLAALAVFQGGGKYAVTDAGIASAIASFVVPIAGLMLAMGEVPPLDVPLARFAFTYWGRRRHLLALRAWGQQHGWRVSLPGGANPALTLQGSYDAAHPVTVMSTASFRMTQGNSVLFTMSVKMGSPYDIVAFRISADPPPAKAGGRVAAGKLRAGLGRSIHYYVVPLANYPLPDGFMERLGTLVDAGRPFLGKLDFAHATPFGLRYTHKSGRRLTPRDAHLDSLLGWMSTLCALLEEVSPRPAPDAA